MSGSFKKILWYLAGSVLFLSLPVVFSPDFNSTLDFLYVPGFHRDFFRYCLLLLFFWLNFKVFIPGLLHGKKYLLFALSQLVSLVVIVALTDIGIPHNMPPQNQMPHLPPAGPHGHFFVGQLNHNLFAFLVVALFSIMLKNVSRLRKIEEEKVSAELSYLKAQINPHFLFNTLNSIYSLAITKSDYTPTAVVKLSGMMRYVITDTDFDKVPLQKEIDYLNDYIELQKLRLTALVELHYNVNGAVQGKNIAPLLLIPFVENAFKYGVNTDEECRIDITIEVKERELVMQVVNKKVKVVKNLEDKGGLGIANTRHRLQLMYPGQHLLNVWEDENKFSVSLTISLI